MLALNLGIKTRAAATRNQRILILLVAKQQLFPTRQYSFLPRTQRYSKTNSNTQRRETPVAANWKARQNGGQLGEKNRSPQQIEKEGP
jgi:hypothetical protein